MGTLADLCANEIIAEKLDKAFEDGYNKAIDEFINALYKTDKVYITGEVMGIFKEIAEQMKAGAE